MKVAIALSVGSQSGGSQEKQARLGGVNYVARNYRSMKHVFAIVVEKNLRGGKKNEMV